jgi:uncharacterized Zn finger protein
MQLNINQNLSVIHHILQLSTDDSIALFGSTIWTRSKGYEDEIDRLSIKPHKITAIVYGSRKYNLALEKQTDSAWNVSCSCPYGDSCKHEAAFIRYIQQNVTEQNLLDAGEKSKNIAIAFATYLDGLSTDKLKELINELATEKFKEKKAAEILKKSTPSSKEKKSTPFDISAIKKKVAKVFEAGDPEDFDDKLDQIFLPLEFANDSHLEQMTDLILFCLNDLDDALNEGRYYYSRRVMLDDDAAYTGESLLNMTIEYLSKISAQNKFQLLDAIEECGEELSFDSYLEDILCYIEDYISEQDIPDTINAFCTELLTPHNKEQAKAVFDFLSPHPLLSEEGKARLVSLFERFD